jgi:hypothetical protein
MLAGAFHRAWAIDPARASAAGWSIGYVGGAWSCGRRYGGPCPGCCRRTAKKTRTKYIAINALLVPLYVSEYGTTGGLQMIWVIVALIPIGLLMAVGVVILVCLTAITRSRRRNGITQPLMWWGYPTAQRPSWTAIRGASEGQPRSLRPTTRHL